MVLKSLELHGFKSFPDKTVLNFDSGSTVIVGPNGSGKSNITDAMRWVLGELSSKSMRGTKMEDVIFIGTDDRKPMSFAEVSVTFDNTDKNDRLNSPYDEITVTRRYYRSGDSEYYINRKPVRLKDINELFMNSGIGKEGYSIVGQGKIAEIVSKKSEERRGIFEETAGITKYRYRKKESEKRLAETEDNMSRVADIMYELERQIPSLERDSVKARKYLELFEQKKRAEVSLWLYDIEKINADLAKTLQDCEISSSEYEMAADTETQLEEKNDRLYAASIDNKQNAQRVYGEISDLRTKLHELENEATKLLGEKDRSVLDKNNALSDIETTNVEIDEENNRIVELNSTLAKLSEKVAALEKENEILKDEKLDVACKRADNETFLENKLNDQREIEAELTELRVRLNVLKNTVSDNKGKESTINSDIKKYIEELNEIKSGIEESNSLVETYTKTKDECENELLDLDSQMADTNEKIDHLRCDVSDKQAEISAIDSKISALARMLEHFDGYNNSVKFVMNEKANGTLKGIHAPITHLIKVEEKNAVAIETAFGSALQNIVVDDEAAAKNAIYALKKAEAGRATFYPLSSVKAQELTKELELVSKVKGFIGYANNLLSCDNKYKNIISSIIGRIAVFDNIENATEAARGQAWKVRCVTLDGQQINIGGSFTGGSVRRESGMLTRNLEIDKLNGERNTEKSKLDAIQGKLDNALAGYEKLKARKVVVEEKKKISEVLLSTENGQLSEYNAKLTVVEGLISQLSDDSKKLIEFATQSGENIAKLEEEEKVLVDKINAISTERQDADIIRHELIDSFDEYTEKINNKQIEIVETQKDIESTNNSIIASNERIEALKNKIVDTTAKINDYDALYVDIDKKLAIIAENKNALQSQIDANENERTELEASSFDYEKRLNDIRIEMKQIADKKELISQAKLKNETKRDRLRETIDQMVNHLWEEYELTNSTALELGYPAVTQKEHAAVEMQFKELKNAVKALGHVNLDSIEQYKEVKERYDTIKVQMDDLTKAKAELTEILTNIETEMKAIFTEAFEKINVYFGEVFKELFGGGHAHLSLTDPNDVLNCGIEISAAPPGKMVKSISLLSGGEQAFVAIALLFALIKVNPSPFCIFDEIEAALDEVNVARVAKYIKKYSESLQIIVITHRRGTMEIADTLYGVTMPHKGVSKVFNLDLNALGDKATMDGLVEA